MLTENATAPEAKGEAVAQDDAAQEAETTGEGSSENVNASTYEPAAEEKDTVAETSGEVSEEELDALWEQAEISCSEQYTGDTSVISFTIQLTP